MTIQSILEELPYMSSADLATLRDAIERQLGRVSSDGLTDGERVCMESGDLIGCVKMIRNRTGLGLRDAKNVMDAARGSIGSRR